MTSREEPQLFDLPLDPEPPRKRQRESRAVGKKKQQAEPEQVELPFEAIEEADLEPKADEEYPHLEENELEDLEDEEVEESLVLERLYAGLADLVVHLAVLVIVLAGMGSFGIVPGWHHVPPLLLFLLPFSFVYSVVPVAFWGQTPGMAWRELRCSGDGDLPLTAGQAIMRWIGGLLTLLLCGLPLLFLLTERSLADRLSGSRTEFSEGAFFQS